MPDKQNMAPDSGVYPLMLSVLRSSIWGESRHPVEAADAGDWDAIYRELQIQTVHHLAVDVLAGHDPGNKDRYVGGAMKNMLRSYRILKEQQVLCTMLQKAGIPCAVAKGASAACYYPDPLKRVMGDIDLLVRPEDFAAACALVEAGGEFLGENSRHREYRRNGVVVEVHRAFGSFRNPEKQAAFDSRIFRAIENAQPAVLESNTYYRLGDLENGLLLLIHMDIHLEDGLGLRQIIDWMLFVDSVLDDEFWHTRFWPAVKELERETLAVTVTRMCQMYLGLRKDITWCAEADDVLCRELMEYILSQGNFGRKNAPHRNRMADVAASARNPLALLRMLQYRGCKNWKVLKKYPILKPLAWAYQLFRYIRAGIRLENPVAQFRQASGQSGKRSTFLKKLGVSRMAEESEEQM